MNLNIANMVYDAEKDCYDCSQGYILPAVRTKQRKKASGYISTKTIYRCADCTGCPVKDKCIKGNHFKTPVDKHFKTLEVSRKFERQRAESLK